MQSALDAYQQIAQFNPNPMQEELFNLIEKNPALLLKAPHRERQNRGSARSKPHRKNAVYFLSFLLAALSKIRLGGARNISASCQKCYRNRTRL